MSRAWKIAPGEHASAWTECLKWGCIVIGWQPLGDYRGYGSKEAILKALKKKCRDWETGKGPRSAAVIWRFVRVIQPTDVIVANDGRGKVVGIGRVESDYLPPGAADNPSEHEWLMSARTVDWTVIQPVQLRKYFFVQDTVWPLEPSQCEEIRNACVEQHKDAKLRTKLDQLFVGLEPHVNLDEIETQKLFSEDSDVEGLRSEYRATRSKRSRRLRNKALQLAKGVCGVCKRDFSKLLNGLGQRVLQVHHCEQLAARDTPSVTKLADLAVVCANCHLLLHIDARKTMTVAQLRNLLEIDGGMDFRLEK